MMRALVLRLIGLVLFLVIIARLDLPHILAVTATVSVWGVGASVMASLTAMALRSWRWRRLLAVSGVAITMVASVLVTARSMAWGAITPARMGELIRIHDLIQRGAPMGRASGLWVVDMGLEVAGALIATTLLCLVDPSILAGFLPRPVSLAILMAALAGLAAAPRLARILGRLCQGVETLRLGFDVIAVLPGRVLVALALFSVVSFFAYAGSVAALAAGMGFLTLMDVAAFSGLASLVNILPITVMGLGTRDATLIGLFALRGWSAEAAVGLSLLTLVGGLLAVASYALVCSGLRRRK